MRQIFSALVLLLVLTTSAYAEHEGILTYNSKKPISCGTPEKMKDIVGGQFGELPYFQGEGLAPAVDGRQFIKTTVVISVNLETTTFSIIEFINPELACIIGGGRGFQFNTPPEKKTKITWEY